MFLCGYSVGRGAVAPAYDAANPSELALGPGAISTMLLSVALSGLASFMSVCAGAALRFGQGASSLLLTGVFVLVPVGVAALMARGAVRRGAQAFVDRREDEAARAFNAGR